MLKLPLSNSPKRLSSRILFSFTLSITLTIILITGVLYINFESNLVQTTNTYVNDSLAQVSYSATQMSKTALSLIMILNVDNSISSLFFDYPPEVEDQTGAQNRLSSYVSANSFLQSVYVYNRYTNLFYDSGINSWKAEDFYDKEIIYILNHFDQYHSLTPIPRVISNRTLNAEDGLRSNVYTYVFYDSLLNRDSNKPEKAIVLNIKEDFIKDMVDSMSSNKNSEIFVIDGTGTLLQSNTSSPMLTKLTDKPFIRKIINGAKPQDSFVAMVDGRKSLVSYTSSTVLDWKFICVTPYEFVMSNVNAMKGRVVVICCILLTLGILASYLLARRINNPVNFLQNNLQTLQIEQKRNLMVQKQVFLKSLLQSGISDNMEKTVQLLRQYSAAVNPTERCCILLLRIDNYYDFCNNNTLSDRSLLKFAVMNITAELCSPVFKNEALDMGEDHAAMLINVGDTTDPLPLLKETGRSIIDAVQQYLELSLSLAISSTGQDFSDAKAKYGEVLEISQYRIYMGRNSIVSFADISEQHNRNLTYPIQKENKLIDALMLGNLEEVQATFNDIVESARNYSYKSLMLTLTRLTTAIHIAVDNYEKNSSHLLGFDFSRFSVELARQEVLEDIIRHFSGLFEYIYEKILEKKDTKYDELIAKVMDIISRNYADRNLSLESISGMVGVSASYIGKLFKKFTTNTVSDHITQTRLEAAKMLLANTDYSVDRITEKIGLTYSNYFYKIFKKTYGITPSEYKKNVSLQKNAEQG